MPVERSTKPGGPPLAAILGAVGAASVAAAAATIVAIRHKASAVPPGTRAKTSGKEDEQPRTSAVTAGGKDIIVPVPSEPGSAPHTSSNQQELSPIEQGGLKETAFPSDAETVTETAKVSQEEHHASEDPPVMQTSEADTSQDDATGMVKSKVKAYEAHLGIAAVGLPAADGARTPASPFGTKNYTNALRSPGP